MNYLKESDIKENHVYMNEMGFLFVSDEWVNCFAFNDKQIRVYTIENEGEWDERYLIFTVYKKTNKTLRYLTADLGEL